MGWLERILKPDTLTSEASHKDMLSHIAVGAIALLFLLIHVCFGVYYTYCQAYAMSVVNLGSVAVYGVILLLNRKRMWQQSCLLIVVELAVYCVLSVYFAGWEIGAQNYLPVMVYPSLLLFHVSVNQRILHVAVLSAAMVACYLQKLYEVPVYSETDFSLMTVANLIACMSAALLTIGITFISTTLSERYYQRLIHDLTDEANQDALTGLWNRRYVNIISKDIFSDFYQKNSTYIASLDIDFFKTVNDTYGHSAGDEVLKQLSAILVESLRSSDVVARWGGEEFVIILKNTSNAGAFTALGKLRRRIEQHVFQAADTEVRLTVTIGFAGCRGAPDYEQCLRYSDAALYHGKRNGRNIVIDYDAMFPPKSAE